LDYLLKPVSIEELRNAVSKASEKLKLKNINTQLNNLLSNMRQSDPGACKLALPNLDSIVFVRFDMITRCEAKGGYTHFYMKDGEKILSSKNIKDYEDILPSTMFMRVHNSHIINLTCIKKYHKGRGGFIEMDDGAMIEVASRRKDKFLAHFSF
jgi:two-component system LytT family response regulator